MSDAADLRASDQDRERAAREIREHFWPLWIGLVCVLPFLRSSWQLYGPAPRPAPRRGAPVRRC